jgi:hypothetical protein
VEKSGKSAARSARLESALRENLKRRKARERALGEEPGDGLAAEKPLEGLDHAARRDQINSR